MGKLLAVAGTVVAALATAVLAATAALLVGAGSPAAAPGGGGGAGPALPAGWAGLYRAAAATCPGLPWSVLAAIGTVESDDGRSTAPGVWSGANAAGAEGPMQFEPATFAAYATAGPGGAVPPSPYDPVDAAYTAAAYLCASGAGRPGGLRAAVFAYNHADVYVATVLALAVAFDADPSTTAPAAAALAFAAGALGTPYRWGGTGPGGFDCSGLVQAAYAAAGVALPRVAEDQFTAGPPVAPGTPVLPGDLLFFGTGPAGVDHVGIYLGAGRMIDAPHTGAPVRVEPAAWSDLVGATRPG